jgi:S-adenosylmethionine hydrolase
LITLLTDFGARDIYVAAMKGVILSLNPQAVLVDLTHEVPPQDIRAGAFLLAAATPHFPEGAIHLAVVDPGVGTDRRALAAWGKGRFWVGPDNGLFSLAWAGATDLKVVCLENPAYFRPQVSATFHGRDLFAPVAAHLSLGVELPRLGPPLIDPVALPNLAPIYSEDTARGEIIYVDHFGNLVSNVPAAGLRGWLGGRSCQIRVGSVMIPGMARTYADVAPGQFLALEGSHGFLEIACHRDSAARRLAAGVGLVLEIRRR